MKTNIINNFEEHLEKTIVCHIQLDQLNKGCSATRGYGSNKRRVKAKIWQNVLNNFITSRKLNSEEEQILRAHTNKWPVVTIKEPIENSSLNLSTPMKDQTNETAEKAPTPNYKNINSPVISESISSTTIQIAKKLAKEERQKQASKYKQINLTRRHELLRRAGLLQKSNNFTTHPIYNNITKEIKFHIKPTAKIKEPEEPEVLVISIDARELESDPDIL